MGGPIIGLDRDPAQSVTEMQESLPEATLLIEYFEARGTLFAFLLSQHDVKSFRLGPSGLVRQSLKFLRFQLGKRSKADLAPAQHHLRELHRLLIAPVLTQLSGYRHLIVAPHRYLHNLPFAALHDGEQSLIDRFTISMTPSASVYARCRTRVRKPTRGSVVMAIPDARAPQIDDEARRIAELLTDSRLISGQAATLDAFRHNASGLKVLHLATHGIFRRDNPLFSAIQLSDGRLSLIDLQHTDLNTDLVTLSACHSGSSVAVGGDELLGLVRGFLSAGARNLLVSLWDIDDKTTREFMKEFYSQYVAGVPLAAALRHAMILIREHYAHPYHWAPFILVGDSVENV